MSLFIRDKPVCRVLRTELKFYGLSGGLVLSSSKL